MPPVRGEGPEGSGTVRRRGPAGTAVRQPDGERKARQKTTAKSTDSKGRSAAHRGRGPAVSAGERHGRELAALASLGLALFLGFVLVAGGEGGILGDGARAGLAAALGRLSFLIPFGLLAAAAVLVFELRINLASLWLYGAMLLLLALLLLTAAGFPPIGEEHGPGSFVAEEYEVRAGWLGEVLHAGVIRLVGPAGVAIAGWLGLLAGASLLTGLTVREVLERAGRTALRAKVQVQATARRRHDEEPGEGPLDPYLTGFGPRPQAGEAAGGHSLSDTPAAWEEAQTWISPHTGGGLESDVGTAEPDIHLIDGPADFPDLYPEGETEGRLRGVSRPPKTQARAENATRGEGGASSSEGADRESARSVAPGSAEQADETVAQPLFEEEVPAYVLPSSELLRKSDGKGQAEGAGDRETAALLVETLSHFGVEARVVGMVTGPRVTRYELQLAPGTKVSKVAGLKDDLAYALASTEIRILAPIPGKSAVGVEVPNRRPSFVTLGDIYRDFPAAAGPLMVWLGKDISGKPVYTDLSKLPHLLIAGTTGSGKSGCVNCIISSILLRARPDQVRLILIDPKKVELSHYERIPHLLVPVVTNMKNAAGVLANVVKEMENRYELMELEKARHLDEMNKTRRRRGEAELPYVVVVVDELADLMMVAPSDVEEYIIRLAQKARAVGIHLVVATQRPSVDVITGMIKANIPSRIAFAVSSQTDSRVILDQNGAEALLGMGDMLFKPLGSSRLQRIQGAYITEEEIQLLVTHTRRQGEPEFREELLQPPAASEEDEEELFDPDEDDLLAEAAELVLDTGSASVSMLQRRLRVGYTRAGRLIDMLERRGIVGPYEGSKPRQILVRPEDHDRLLEGLRVQGDRPQELFPEEPDDDEVI